MGGLKSLGVGVGDRVATLGFNHFRHLEAYFAVPGMGAVLHTANPRLSPKEIAYILNHAEDRVLLLDPQLLPLVEAIRGELKTVAHFVIMDAKAPEGYLSYPARGRRGHRPLARRGGQRLWVQKTPRAQFIWGRGPQSGGGAREGPKGPGLPGGPGRRGGGPGPG